MTNQGGFGGIPQEPGLKANMMNLIHSIRTVMRSKVILPAEIPTNDHLFQFHLSF